MLGLAVAAEVFARFPSVDSGRLTKIHNQAVSGVSCAEVGRRSGCRSCCASSRARASHGGIPAETLLDGERPLPEATEALIGACFLAFGFERTAAAVAEAFEPRIELASETRIDFKSALQELLARRGARVTYEVTERGGPAARPHLRGRGHARRRGGRARARVEARRRPSRWRPSRRSERLGG